MLKQLWQRLVQCVRRLLHLDAPPPPARLHNRAYQQLFEQLLAGVAGGWNQAEIVQHLGERLNDKHFRAWLRDYGGQLRQLPEGDHRLGWQMTKLSRAGCGQLGEMAAEIGRELLAKPAKKSQEPEPRPTKRPEPPGEVTSNGGGNQPESDDAEGWLELGNQRYWAGDFAGAIASYDRALEIKPDNHQAWYNRGVALVYLGRYEEAIASYDRALAIKPDFHEAWSNRGVALFYLGRYEEAIASYDRALAIKPDFHEAWSNRGATLVSLGRYEEAIASCDRALAIKPDDHEVWGNRGGALVSLGRYEEAIASCDRALAIKPDNHQAWSNRGLALDKLGRYEEAIASYDRALAIKADSDKTWLNRGGTAGNSRGYNSQIAAILQIQFPQLPPLFPNLELTKRGYQGEIFCYQTGLQQCPQATHPEGWGLLHRAMGKAHYDESKQQRDYHDHYWQKAEAEYRLALTALTATAFPQRHLETVQQFLRVLLALDKEEEAKTWRQQGVEVYLQLLNSPQSSRQKKQLRATFIVFAQMQVDQLAADGHITLALQAAEANKNFYLSWILDAQNTNIFSPSYEEIQQLVKPQTALIYWHLSPLALTTFLILPATEPILIPTPQRQAFAQLIDQWDREYQAYRGKEGNRNASWKENLPTFLKQLGEILQIATILPYLQSVRQLVLVPHQDLHRLPLHALFPDAYTMTYLPSAQLGLNIQAKLANPNAAAPYSPTILCVAYPDSSELAPLPFAAIEAEAMANLWQVADDNAFAWLRRRQPTLAQLPPDSVKNLEETAATREAVTKALIDGYNIWHFTGHGGYDWQHPEKSELALSGNDKLTLAEVCRLNLNSYQLVFLSACETAITGRESIDKEYIGLVSAFVYQQIPYTISTLWTVPDSPSSVVLVVYFYWQLKKGKSPAKALAAATKWLRGVRYQQLERIYKLILPRLSDRNFPTLSPFVRHRLHEIATMDAAQKRTQPYASPYFWAAFTITGHSD